jgi:hypothetical protein
MGEPLRPINPSTSPRYNSRILVGTTNDITQLLSNDFHILKKHSFTREALAHRRHHRLQQLLGSNGVLSRLHVLAVAIPLLVNVLPSNRSSDA